MKTKKLVERRLSKVRESHVFSFVKMPNYVTILQRFPYGKRMGMNQIYHFMCQFIQKDTNRLVLYDANGKFQYADKHSLFSLSNYTRKTFDNLLNVLVFDGVLMFCRCAGYKFFIMNPYFAIAGNKIDQYVIELFTPTEDYVFGEDIFVPDNLLDASNKNIEHMNGDFRKFKYSKLRKKIYRDGQ